MIERRRSCDRIAVLFVSLAALIAPSLQARGGKRCSLRLELGGGWQFLDPGDLNQAVAADDQLQDLQYERYLAHLQDAGSIRSWNARLEGRRRPVRGGAMFEPRLRLDFAGPLSVSAGLRVMEAGRSCELLSEYTRELGGGDQDVETLSYSPYRLSVRGWWPSIAVHFRRRLVRHFVAEAHAALGPLFASVRYRAAWTYAWDMRGPDYSWPVFRSEGEREEKGSGTGVGVELGGRFERALNRRLALFLAAGYYGGRVNSLSGTGREERAASTWTWSGKWLTRQETVITPWGTLSRRFPTCRPQEGASDSPFRLDLSGWLLRIGLSLKL
ncbi:MAG: hypothetical protein JXO51_08110 [Candidatus Aminicenantes bacterium]|nr:hypothetical protein [Candidatus Aminicenantes bacterium]